MHYCSASQFKKIISDPACLFFSNYIGAPSATIIRNEKKQFFDTALKWLVDVDWYIRSIKNGAVVYTKEPLICTIHGGEGQVTQAVQSDKKIQVREHVYLMDKLYSGKMDISKYSRLFQLLFHKYQVDSMDQLRALCDVPSRLENFLSEAIEEKKNSIFLKKLLYWLKKKSVNDHLFTLKTWLR